MLLVLLQQQFLFLYLIPDWLHHSPTSPVLFAWLSLPVPVYTVHRLSFPPAKGIYLPAQAPGYVSRQHSSLKAPLRKDCHSYLSPDGYLWHRDPRALCHFPEVHGNCHPYHIHSSEKQCYLSCHALPWNTHRYGTFHVQSRFRLSACNQSRPVWWSPHSLPQPYQVPEILSFPHLNPQAVLINNPVFSHTAI